MTLKEKIQFLLDSGLSQIDIADKTGIPQPTFSKIMSGVQTDVLYSRGIAIDLLVQQTMQARPKQATA